MKTVRILAGGGLLSVALCATLADARADSGFYLGASAGGSSIESDLDGVTIPGLPSDIDEDDTALKFYGGYNFDLPAIKLAIEGGYVDFGEADIDVLGDPLTVEVDGLQVWGIVGVDAGLVDLYGKAGFLDWEADASFAGATESDSGTDIGYGIGAAFGIGPVQIRGEYELFELDDTDVTMLSLGVTYQF